MAVEALLFDFGRGLFDPFFEVGMPFMAVRRLVRATLDVREGGEGCGNSIPFIFGDDKRLLLVFFRQDSVVCVRNFCNDAFIHAFPHGIKICGLVMVQVLATPDSRRDLWLRFR